MLTEKQIKILIVIGLFLMEIFVWTANAYIEFVGIGNSSVAIIGGADGPTAIFVAGAEHQSEDDKTITEEEPQLPPPSEQPVSEQEPEENEAAFSQADKTNLLILVNKKNPVNKNYKPDDLKEIKYFAADRSPETRFLRAEAADAFNLMVEKAAEEDLEFKMTTAYRSFGFQKILYDNYVAQQGEEAANKFSAKPGQSEHQTGLAVDVSSPSVDFQLTNEYGETKEGKWLAAHAYEYGFIIRFPKGKEDVTGYQYEPWHLRYVGLTAAKEIYDSNLTLEEYLQENNL